MPAYRYISWNDPEGLQLRPFTQEMIYLSNTVTMAYMQRQIKVHKMDNSRYLRDGSSSIILSRGGLHDQV